MSDHEWFFADLGLLTQAEQKCRQRIENDPENLALLRTLAESLRKQGRLEEAAATYARIGELDANDDEAAYLAAVLGGQELPVPPAGNRAAPFVLVKKFLPPDFRQEFFQYFNSVSEKFLPVMGKEQYAPESRQALQFQGTWSGRRQFQRALAESLRKVITRLELPRISIQTADMVIRAYGNGHFFRVHRDAPPSSSYANRLLNYVYYFHKSPRPYSGGELLLFDSDVAADTHTLSRFTRVIPEDNMLALFPPNYYHCVNPVCSESHEFSDSRFVINGHFLGSPFTAKSPGSADSCEDLGTTATLLNESG